MDRRSIKGEIFFRLNYKNFLRELLVNFALIYSLIVGIIFISYSIYRGIYNSFIYGFAIAIFLIYLTFWIIDKVRFLYGKEPKNSDSI